MGLRTVPGSVLCAGGFSLAFLDPTDSEAVTTG